MLMMTDKREIKITFAPSQSQTRSYVLYNYSELVQRNINELYAFTFVKYHN